MTIPGFRLQMRRLPPFREIVPVYAVIVSFIYGWTLIRYFWQVPSWLFYLQSGDLLAILSYALSVNLAESLFALAALLVGAIVLPRAWLADAFVTRGTIASAVVLAYAIWLASEFVTRKPSDYPAGIIRLAPVVLVSAVVAAFVAGKVGAIRNLVEGLADRATIFLYLSVPLSVASVIAVTARNLW